MARKKPPDVILLDVMMPQQDGMTVLRELKRDSRTMAVPVIMVTAMEDEATRVQASGGYAQDYLVKPVGLDAVRTKIDKVLSG